jgi:hypothetical protein
MLMLSAELANDQSAIHIRNAAGIAIKNALTARVSYTCHVQPVSLSLISFRIRSGKENILLGGWLLI